MTLGHFVVSEPFGIRQVAGNRGDLSIVILLALIYHLLPDRWPIILKSCTSIEYFMIFSSPKLTLVGHIVAENRRFKTRYALCYPYLSTKSSTSIAAITSPEI